MQTSFWDTHQSLQSNGSHTLAKSSASEPQTDGSQTCQCGKGMFDCLIHPSTRDEWIASMRDSLAKICQSQETRQELALKQEVASTVKSSASLAWFDRDTSSWKTSQQSLLSDSEQSCQTWPRSGMTRNGYAYALPIVGLRITGTDGGYLPTPDTNNHRDGRVLRKDNNLAEGGRHGVSLHHFATMFPTPATRDYKGARLPETMEATGRNPKTNSLPDAVGEQSGLRLNPTWVEWLMGFPIGFTALKDSAMLKSRSKRQSRGNCSEENK